MIGAALLAGAAWAAPVGEPVADPEAARVRLGARFDSWASRVSDDACDGAASCDAVWRSQETSFEAQLALLRGLGLFGELGHDAVTVSEAGYSGAGVRTAVGLRGALSLGGPWWLGVNARVDWSRGQAAAEVGDAPAVHQAQRRTASLLGAWGEPGDGVSLWAGGQVAWGWFERLYPLGEDELEIPLRPAAPLTGVFGAALTSEPLGVPWTRSVRVSVTAEARLGQENGASVALQLGI